jgi:hypothetical protein
MSVISKTAHFISHLIQFLANSNQNLNCSRRTQQWKCAGALLVYSPRAICRTRGIKRLKVLVAGLRIRQKRKEAVSERHDGRLAGGGRPQRCGLYKSALGALTWGGHGRPCTGTHLVGRRNRTPATLYSGVNLGI